MTTRSLCALASFSPALSCAVVRNAVTTSFRCNTKGVASLGLVAFLFLHEIDRTDSSCAAVAVRTRSYCPISAAEVDGSDCGTSRFGCLYKRPASRPRSAPPPHTWLPLRRRRRGARPPCARALSLANSDARRRPLPRALPSTTRRSFRSHKPDRSTRSGASARAALVAPDQAFSENLQRADAEVVERLRHVVQSPQVQRRHRTMSPPRAPRSCERSRRRGAAPSPVPLTNTVLTAWAFHFASTFP